MFYIGTHRPQDLTYESHQWWQTDHFWTDVHYLFMQQIHDGSHEWVL